MAIPKMLRLDRSALDIGDVIYAVLALVSIVNPAVTGDRSVWTMIACASGVAVYLCIVIRIWLHISGKLGPRGDQPN